MHRITVIVALICASAAWADDVSVAVASNFAAPMRRLAAGFERETGHKIVASFGSTGQFYAQIRNGAPFDVLLAADAATPERLEADGLAIAGSRFTYAVGVLVLWSAKPGFVDDRGAVLKAGNFRHLAIANPRLAPYGASAVGTLGALGLLAVVQPKFVVAENVSQAYQFVASGNCELGFVALSQVQTDGRITAGSAWTVPADLHPPIRQDAAVLVKGRGKRAVDAFVGYLQGEAARTVIRSFGYML
ncbi:molybdate ABC transporter substrate-binding protein [Candidatus Binatia bacterium]|nr:molybdate ABC transporter substrate-binding protein [Candidatus Binatia bacterium]